MCSLVVEIFNMCKIKFRIEILDSGKKPKKKKKRDLEFWDWEPEKIETKHTL